MTARATAAIRARMRERGVNLVRRREFSLFAARARGKLADGYEFFFPSSDVVGME